MEDQIKKLAFRIKCCYTLLWVVAFLLVLSGELGIGWVGCLTDDAQAVYLSETMIILLTAICIPVSLKLFSWMMIHRIDQLSIQQALIAYFRISVGRLFLLALPVVVGLLIYYMMLTSTGALCALIALTASLFCVPSEKRMKNELHIDKLKEEE